MSNTDGVDSAIAILQDRSLGNELDYQFVMHCLQNYQSPRAKLTRLLASGALIRVRKGLYVLGERFVHTPYCLELISNLVYGPSYVSLERALQIYGLIPEHVEMVTCVTIKPSKTFKTSIGNFLYASVPEEYYSVGVTQKQFSKHENALIACPEKALIDMLVIRRGKITSKRQIENILLEDLRIDEDDLLALDLEQVRKIYKVISHSAVHFFEKWLAHRKGKSQ